MSFSPQEPPNFRLPRNNITMQRWKQKFKQQKETKKKKKKSAWSQNPKQRWLKPKFWQYFASKTLVSLEAYLQFLALTQHPRSMLHNTNAQNRMDTNRATSGAANYERPVGAANYARLTTSGQLRTANYKRPVGGANYARLWAASWSGQLQATWLTTSGQLERPTTCG